MNLTVINGMLQTAQSFLTKKMKKTNLEGGENQIRTNTKLVSKKLKEMNVELNGLDLTKSWQ